MQVQLKIWTKYANIMGQVVFWALLFNKLAPVIVQNRDIQRTIGTDLYTSLVTLKLPKALNLWKENIRLSISQ